MVDNNPKATSDMEQVDNKAVDKVDKNAPFSLKEAKAVVGAEEGKIEEAIEKDKFKKDKEIAPDLKELKKEKDKVKKEVKEKKEEVKKAVKTEEKIVTPSKFDNKTPEERLEIYKEMESSFTKKSQKIAELEAKVTDLSTVDKKIEDLKKESVIRQEKTVQVKLPDKPKMSLFYEDPEKYFEAREKYSDAKRNAALAPLYGSNWTSQEDKIVGKIKKDTKDDVIPYSEVEDEVKTRVRRNPAIVNQYGLAVNEYFYNQIRNEMLPQKILDVKTEAKEEAKKELAEEKKETSEEQIMSSDITTQKRESKAVELKELLDKEGPESAINAYKKKYHVDRDI